MRNRRLTLAAPPPDPFGERQRAAWHERLQLLGGRFDFEGNSPALLRLVRAAYAGLPAHRLSGAVPHFHVRLLASATSRMRSRPRGEPSPVQPLAGAGILCGTVGPASFVALAPGQHAALVVVARDMLRHAYHVRYELLEFAVYVLAARAQGLLPLHAACLGRDGAGVLLVGPSGSGKSTLVLQCLLGGLDFLAEDSVLVSPRDLLATGVPTFLHLCRDSLRFVTPAQRRALLRAATVIRRRSGVEKLEIDVRCLKWRPAVTPLRIHAVIFLSRRSAHGGRLLQPLPGSVMLHRLAASQRYAATQPGWSTFRRQLSRLPAYELRRGSHPQEAAGTLRDLLADNRRLRR